MNKQQAQEQLNKLMIEAEKHKEIINSPDKTKEERFFELNEINEAKDHLTLILIFWIPFTIGVVGHLWGLIAWDIFGNTDYVAEYYTSRFNSGIESYLWIINEIGVFATILCGVVALMYLWLCRKVWLAIFR